MTSLSRVGNALQKHPRSLDLWTSVLEKFTYHVRDVNAEFSTGSDSTDVFSMTFSSNSIAIKKRNATSYRTYKHIHRLGKRVRKPEQRPKTRNHTTHNLRHLQSRPEKRVPAPNDGYRIQIHGVFGDILNRSRSDKYWQHEYHLVYEDLFAPYRNDNVSLLEIGITSAKSMKAWGDYFTNPKAVLTGVSYRNHSTFTFDRSNRCQKL